MVKKLVAGLIVGVCLMTFVELGASQAFEDTRGKQYIGNVNSNTYHCINCEAVKNISRDEKTIFNSAQEAIKAGCKPCPVCNPPVQD